MPAREVEDYLAKLLHGVPESLHPIVDKFQRFYDRKLWHQLTLAVFEFLEHPDSKPFQLEVYNKFVSDFQAKLDRLRLAQIGVKVSREISADSPQHVEFLVALKEKISVTDHPQAHALVLTSLAHAKLLFADAIGARTDLEEAGSLLENVDGVDKSVHAAYYEVKADYHKMKGEYAPYYKHSLLYLACVDIDKDLNGKQRFDRAKDLSLSALLADSIYNFGELIMHPILDSLKHTPEEWLGNLLFTFNEGNIQKFDSLTPLFPKEPILQHNFAFLRQKICLMALIETVFRRKASERTLTFQTIAEETQTPLGEVEHLVMKALSLKLIAGTLDEPAAKAHITWVQPRVLSRTQIEALAGSLTNWLEKMDGLEGFVKEEGGLVMV
ncbi:Probable 26S proteasome regulatory subunit rpn9 [Serendipita indica DSM 11827]|uniref:Related to 26S proteasome regulatory particle chain RPN9 n=1 Tax=Serendipita indica (strain DSM 11827) TaxID=1109443 RepID=G4TIY6_SERID|nr:Probable 26S proteasome regulatory subunit rpn9 [Serendipita indica DSM 11827]CCA71293.1 related to 26S proteasome regulatory particle chain RPN9 [Serendipita indica DSM 11827]